MTYPYPKPSPPQSKLLGCGETCKLCLGQISVNFSGSSVWRRAPRPSNPEQYDHVRTNYLGRVIAPSDAECTNAAYFPNTPVAKRGFGAFHFQHSLVYVDSNHVALMNRRDRPTQGRLRRNMADHQAASRAAESAISQKCN